MDFNFDSIDDIPGVAELREELGRNLTDQERMASAFASAGLLPLAAKTTGLLRWGLVLASGALLYRSLRGHCPVYEKLGIDRRHPKPGVSGNRGTRVEAAIDIACPAETLYSYWRNLAELPKVMRHVTSVTEVGGYSHWKIKGPLGQTLEWDAEIINEHPGRLIAWQSLPGASVENAGSVRFEPSLHQTTHVRVAFEYDPPAGKVGSLIAGILGSSPQRFLEEDLASFKQFAEQNLAPQPR